MALSLDSVTQPERLTGEGLLTHLLAISHHMAGMRSVAPLLSYVVDQVMALVGAESGYIVLLKDDGSLDFKVRRCSDGTDIQSDVDSISSTVLDEVIRTKESVVVRNALMDPQFGGAMSVMAMQLRSIMCSPLITQNRIIGAIYVENRLKSGRFVKADVVPLEFFSNHAAVAIENARLNENLETLVEERTSELVKAKEVAEAATRAKSIFLSTMTHELRTPMNGVLGMTSLLMDTQLNEEQKEIVDIIRSSGDTLLTLISDILDFSKIEAQKVELDPVSFRLDNCIEQAMDLVMPVAADKNLHVAYRIDDNVPLGLVQDITRIRQVLTNLLSNAVKFTEHGQVDIHVALSDPPNAEHSSISIPEETKIMFKITDTGIGISADRMYRLFQPFSQAESSTNHRYGGTGLGLVICKRLCELMGGTIQVQSEVGKGTTFSFSIAAQIAHTSDRAHEELSASLAGKRMLLISSSRLIERSVRQSLRRCDVNLVCQPSLPADTHELEPVSAVIIDTTISNYDSLVDEILQSKPAQANSSGVSDRDLALDPIENANGHGNGVTHRYTNAEPPHDVSTPAVGPFDLIAVKINKPIILLTHWKDRFSPINSEYPIAVVPAPIKNSQLRSELAHITGASLQSALREENQSAFDATMASTYPLSILLAEDNIVNQKVALRMLERCGYHADLVENGLDALEALHKQIYDVVLMDVQMPVMDGVEATQRIRAEIPHDRQPYIVAMTANVTSDARERYLGVNMDEYISKPVSVNELQATLRIAALRQGDKVA